MNPQVIKSFLVGLGFGVDDTSLSKFNKAIASATLKVTALYASVKSTAAGIVYGISKISEGFEAMGYEYRIIAPAINKALVLRRELLKAYSAAGINITKVVQASVRLNMSLAKTKFAFEAIYRSVGSRFFAVLTKQSDEFRKQIYANMPRIQDILERLIKFIFKSIEAIQQLGSSLWMVLQRVYDFFKMLDDATNGWSTIILGAVAAWDLLNLSFLATPLGMIIGGLVAILALFDDFEVWKEGGKSLFDWSSFVPVINAVGDAMKAVWGIVQGIADALSDLILAFLQLAQGDTLGFWESLNNYGKDSLAFLLKVWEAVKGIGRALAAVGGWGAHLAGLSSTAAFLNNAAANAASVNSVNPNRPLGIMGAVGGAQTNQAIHQQTNIVVQGSADAAATGQNVAGQQTRVNGDIARNLKSIIR